MAKNETPAPVESEGGAPDLPERKVNNSKGKPYYSQRNNKIKPGSSCNVTSMINALSAAGWPVEKLAKDGEQPEDTLMRFALTDPICASAWRRLDPNGNFPPNEWHSILTLGANRLVHQVIGDGKHAGLFASHFTENADAASIAAAIRAGGAAAVSGLFTLPDGSKLNHVVSVVGVVGGDDPIAFILDDPWGDYRTGYKNHSGNDVEMPMADFLTIIKFPGQPRKMAHLIRRYEA